MTRNKDERLQNGREEKRGIKEMVVELPGDRQQVSNGLKKEARQVNIWKIWRGFTCSRISQSLNAGKLLRGN